MNGGLLIGKQEMSSEGHGLTECKTGFGAEEGDLR